MFERLLCVIMLGFMGLLAGVVLGGLVATVLWGGYCVSWGEIAPWEVWRQMAGMFGSTLGLAGMVLGGVAGGHMD